MLILENRLIELKKAKARLYYESMTSSERERKKKESRNSHLFQEKTISLGAGPRTAAGSATVDVTFCCGIPP